MAGRPRLNSEGEKELAKAQMQFDDFNKQVKDLTLDRMNEAPKEEKESNVKLSQSEIEKSKDVYLKPTRSIGAREKFNEDYRQDYNYAKEYVRFIPEHKEIIGENIEMWTKPFAGMPAEYWEVPTGKPVWGPRYLAEQMTKCKYHRLRMEQKVVSSDGTGQFYGQMVADTTVQRIDAVPVSSNKSLFMGSTR